MQPRTKQRCTGSSERCGVAMGGRKKNMGRGRLRERRARGGALPGDEKKTSGVEKKVSPDVTLRLALGSKGLGARTSRFQKACLGGGLLDSNVYNSLSACGNAEDMINACVHSFTVVGTQAILGSYRSGGKFIIEKAVATDQSSTNLEDPNQHMHLLHCSPAQPHCSRGTNNTSVPKRTCNTVI